MRAVGLAVRNEFLVFLGLVIFLSVFSVIVLLRSGFSFAGPFMLQLYLLLAIMFPFSVWRTEGPERRAYHYAMPIPATLHTMTKAVAGWLWLLIFVAVSLGIGVATILIETAFRPVPLQLSQVPLWTWISQFAGTTVVYWLISIFVIGTEHPRRWFVVIGVVYLLGTSIALSTGHWEWASRFNLVATGRYGFMSAISGNFLPSPIGASVNDHVIHGRMSVAEPGNPPIAAFLLWWSIGIVGTTLVARWRPTRRVTWRWR